jgi:hypothetical protein
MPRHNLTRIRDLGIVLKDMESYIKDPRFLRVGREFTNFPLRPREALANWLMCVVGNHENGNADLTFTSDPTGGDGILLKSGQQPLHADRACVHPAAAAGCS